MSFGQKKKGGLCVRPKGPVLSFLVAVGWYVVTAAACVLLAAAAPAAVAAVVVVVDDNGTLSPEPQNLEP